MQQVYCTAMDDDKQPLNTTYTNLPPVGPLQYLLGPVHAHEAVHLAPVDHLHLSSVPQLVMRLTTLQLLPAHMHTRHSMQVVASVSCW